MKATTNVRGGKKIKNFRLKKREDRAIQQILQIEALETRMLLSGVGTSGDGKKKVVFFDADGDKVTVKLTHAGSSKGHLAPTFDIMLDGAATDHANIQSIVIHGDAQTALSVFVQPQKISKLRLPVSYEGGLISEGLTEIGSITNTNTGTRVGNVTTYGAGTDLRGVMANAAFIDNVNITGNLGGLAIDIGASKFFGWTADEISQIHFGNVNVTGNLGALTLRGVSNSNDSFNGSETTYTNDLAGSITVGGTLGMLNARFSNVLAPITANAIGNLQVQDISANITATTSIGSVVATDLYAQIAGNTIGTVSLISAANFNNGTTRLNGDLVGTITATTSLANVSVVGDFEGTINVTNGSLTNGVVIGGTRFTGNILASGSIGNVLVAQNGHAVFSGHIAAATGSIGNLTAGAFDSALVEAGTSIGTITSLNTDAQWHTGIENSQFTARNGGIGAAGNQFAINSAGDIDDSTFSATGAIGNVNVGQGGLAYTVITGASIGNVTSNYGIYESTLAATGAIGNISSTSGWIGYTSVSGASIGNITALDDVYSSTFVATTGSIGNLTVSKGQIYETSVTANTNIGNISASSADSNDAIEYSNFVATTGSIGNISGVASALGGDGIENSAFTAGTSIGTINAATNAPGDSYSAIEDATFRAVSGIGSTTAHAYGDGDAIDNTTFSVTGAGNIGAINATAVGGAAISFSTIETLSGNIGNISGKAIGGAGIDSSTIHTLSGNIGNVTGTSGTADGIYNTQILADGSNIGLVTGISTTQGNGLLQVTIAAGAGLTGTGTLTGVYGRASEGSGIKMGLITAGSGGIGSITGVSTGTNFFSNLWNGLDKQSVFTTGTIGAISGTSANNNGIAKSTFSADGGITSINGTTTSQRPEANGINASLFRAGANIGNITASTAIVGATAINGDASTSTDSISFGKYKGISVPTVTAGSTIFSAGGNIGNITIAQGNLNGAVFAAGYDIGSDLRIDGIGTGLDFAAQPDGAGNIVGNTIGNITVSKGNLSNSSFTASVVTTDNTFGDTDDVLNVVDGKSNGSTVGTIAVSGVIDTVVVAADSLNASAVNAGRLNALYLHAYRGSLNNISVSANMDGESAVANSVFQADVGTIGNITVSQTSAGGRDGISNSTFIAGAATLPLGATSGISNITVLTNGGGAGADANAINDSLFLSNNGIGNISATVDNNTGAYAISGITGSTFASNVDLNDSGAIGNVTATTNGLNAKANGIDNSGFYAAQGIGNVSGSVTSVSGDSGLLNVKIFGNHGEGGELLGTGSVGNVTGTTTGLGSGQDDTWIWGQTIGNITGTASSTTATTVQFGLTDVLADAQQKIGNIEGTVVGRGVVGEYNAGINSSEFYAGTADGSVGGEIGTILGSASTIAAKGNQVGIRNSSFQAGTNAWGGSVGTIGTITAMAKAISATDDIKATGIYNSSFDALGYPLDVKMVPVSTIGNITADATAQSGNGDATARGIYDADFTAGASNGLGASKIGTVTITATVNTGFGGDVTADGLTNSNIDSNGLTGEIGAINIRTSATTGDLWEAWARGVRNTDINAGYGDQNVGSIASLISNATAVSAEGEAHAYGTIGLDLTAGTAGPGTITGFGTIGNVTASGTATGLTKAQAGGLMEDTDITAGAGVAGTGSIGAVTGTAAATVNGLSNVEARARGIHSVDVVANGGLTGAIGDVTGTGTAIANSTGTSSSSDAEGVGIDDSDFVALALTSTIGDVYGKGQASATITGAASTSSAIGFGIGTGVLFSAGNIADGVGTIGNGALKTIHGIGEATAVSNNPVLDGATKVMGGGIAGTNFIAGQTTGTVAANGITGEFTGSATGASALAIGTGIGQVIIDAAATGKTGVLGTVGNITGTAAVTAIANGAAADDATAWGFGVLFTNVTAADGIAATGTIGNITGTVSTLKATAAGTGADALISGGGLVANVIVAGNSDVDSIGLVGNITGTIGSVGNQATATAADGDADASMGVSGIGGLDVSAGAANGNSVSSVGNITGQSWTTATSAGAGNTTNIRAVGIADGTISVVYGSGKGQGTIGDIKGESYVTGTSDDTTTVLAGGIATSWTKLGFLAGGSDIGGKGTIANGANGIIGISEIKATGTDVGAAVIGGGIAKVTFIAEGGENGSGTIAGTAGIHGTVTGTADGAAASITGAGIYQTTLMAANVSTKTSGTIGAITGAANVTATATGTAVTDTANALGAGVFNALVIAGSNNTGTIGAIKGTVDTLKASSVGAGASATITGGGLYENTFTAGTIAAAGAGTIGDITGTVGSAGNHATATAADGNANATVGGIADFGIQAGAPNGTGTSKVGAITGQVWTTAKAAGAGYDTTINAGGITNWGGAGTVLVVPGTSTGTSSIGAIKGEAHATGSSADFTSINSAGIYDFGGGVNFTAGGDKATIGSVTGISTAKATGNYADVNGYGVHGVVLSAAATGIDGTVGLITGTTTVEAISTGTSGVVTGADGWGINHITVNVGNGVAAGAKGQLGDGTDALKGSASVTASSVGTGAADGAYAYGRGISTDTINVGRNGTGTVNNITGTVDTLSATAIAGNATVDGRGIRALDLYVGDNIATSAGTIGSITGSVGAVTAEAVSTTGTETADVYGIRNSDFYAGGTGALASGVIGAITGTATGAANTTAEAYGIRGVIVNSASVSTAGGTIGQITGTASGVATSAGFVDGIGNSTFLAGTSIAGIAGTSTNATGGNGIGIYNSIFNVDNGNIGAITASAAGLDAIFLNQITALGSIASITTTATGTGLGSVEDSTFIAGWSTQAGGHQNVGAVSIGAVNVAGRFTASDLLAGVVTVGNVLHGGNAGDVTTAGGGSIGAIVIGLPNGAGEPVWVAGGAVNWSHGIEAHSIASVNWGTLASGAIGTGAYNWGYDANNSGTASNADTNDVVVRHM